MELVVVCAEALECVYVYQFSGVVLLLALHYLKMLFISDVT